MQDQFGVIEEQYSEVINSQVQTTHMKRDGYPIKSRTEEDDIYDEWLIQDALGG